MNRAVYSMTGFASAKLPYSPAIALTLDIRSVNSRFLDLSFKLPDSHKHLEHKLRELVSAQIRRGKCEVRLNVQSLGNSESHTDLDLNLIQKLLAQQAQIQALSPSATELSVAELIHLASKQSGAGAEAGTQAAAESALLDDAVLMLCQTATTDFNTARALEGQKLAYLMLASIHALRTLRERVVPLVPALVEQQRQRFIQKFTEAISDGGGKISSEAAQERGLTEATAFAIRVDVTEEVDRLGSHLLEIDHLLNQPTAAQGLGKRLEFLIQELHREANTLGSKSATLATTQIAVEMKVLIEQLREQIQNIE
jgi:uncharacterized protein (TIGR00255 family)